MKQKPLSAMFYRDGRLFLASLWRILLLGLVFAAICCALAFAAFFSLTDDSRNPISLAVVDEDDSMLSRAAFHYVRSQRNIAAIVSAELTSEEKALLGIDSGDYLGAVILPEGYLDAVLTGKSTHGRVLIADGFSVNTEPLYRLVGVGENLIRMGQYGVFAGASVVWRHPETRPLYDTYVLRINDALIYEATTATDRYIIDEELSYSDTLALLPHTLLIALLTTLSLFTLLFYRPCTADLTPPRISRLWASGVTPLAFLTPKLVIAFAFRLGFALLFLIPVSLAFPLTIGIFDILGLALALFLVCATQTLFSIALAGNRFGVAIFSLLLLPELFCIGGILPLSYLSAPIAAIGEWLPLGLAYRLCAPFFGGQVTPSAWFGLLLWSLLSFSVAFVRIRHISIEGGAAK